MNIKHNQEWYNTVCSLCGNKFHLKPYLNKKIKVPFCSKECRNKWKSENMKGEKNLNFGKYGCKNHNWKSDTLINGFGYLIDRKLDHPFCTKKGFVLRHRLVAEEHLLTPENSVEINGKRYLKKEYDVHHKNFDKMDNRPENLQVMTKHEHISLHRKLNQNNRNEKTGRFEKGPEEIIKIKRVTETAIIPEKQSIGAAGFDLYVDSDVPVEIKPHETVMLYSGIAFQIPRMYCGMIFARSGLSTREGLRPATCVSIIDSDFRGNVGLPMHNDSNETRIIQPHERVAQIVFQKAIVVEFNIVDKLDETERGEGGFGSTGR